MLNNRRLHRAGAAVLAALLTAQSGAYAADNRDLILLPEEERQQVLEEMRGLLATVSAVVDATAAGDMDRVAAAARQAGMAATRDTPPSLPPRLPMPFKQMGMQMHQSFDQIAMDAQSLRDRDHVLGQLGRAMQLCVACHAAYGFTPNAQNGSTTKGPAK